MPFTLKVRGLVMCVFDSDRIRALLLNSGYEPSHQVPYHIPTLALPRNAATSGAKRALPSLHGRAAIREYEDDQGIARSMPMRAQGVAPARNETLPKPIDRDLLGWDLSGRTLTISSGTGAPRRRGGSLTETHPDPANPDWSDLHWVMDLNRFRPDSQIKQDALRLGSLTTAIAELTGGAVAGGAPANGQDANWVWFFSPGVTQAVTDTLEWSTNEETTIVISDAVGELERITIGPDGVGYLLNEAAAVDNARELALARCESEYAENVPPQARHAAAYLEAVDLKDPTAKYPPRALFPFAGDQEAWEGTFCIILRA